MSYTELKSGYPTGKKDHMCGWCSELIPKGEKHFARTYIWQGEFLSDRMHLECEKAMDTVPREQLEDGWCPGDYPRGGHDTHEYQQE